jgi:hypothetical protein
LLTPPHQQEAGLIKLWVEFVANTEQFRVTVWFGLVWFGLVWFGWVGFGWVGFGLFVCCVV